MALSQKADITSSHNMGLPSSSISRPVTVLMFFIAVLLIGIICLLRLPIELMPNYSFGDISIFVDVRGGMPPTEVETLIAKPIEEAVGTTSYLRNIVSISEEGRCRVVLEFEPGINMDFVSLEVREKFYKIKNKLPPEIEKPVIAKFEQSDVPILNLAVTGLGFTPETLRKFVDEFLKDKLMRIEGVANIDIGGGRERKILVEVSQERLQALNIPLGKVINMLNLNNLNLLIGKVEKGKDKYLIRTLGTFADIEQIKRIGVATTPTGSIIRLKDIAQIKDSYLEAVSYARVNKLPVVSLYVQKESTANTVKVTDEVLKALDDLKPKIDKRLKVIVTYNQADSIKRAIDSVKKSLYHGSILAVLILFAFLRSFRSIFIIAIAIPTSIIATFSLMYFQKLSLNIMTLSGLALGSGMLIDNSIVVLEHTQTLLDKGIERIKACTLGAQEMILAIVSATITHVVVFLPIVFVNKEIRLMYSGLAMTITYSLVVSLLVALTIVPMLSARLGGGAQKPKKIKPKKPGLTIFKKIYKRYRHLLAMAMRHRYAFMFVVVIIFAISAFMFTKIEKEFIGATEAEDFTIFVELPTGAKLDISDQAVIQIEQILSKIPDIKTVSSRVEPWSSKVYVKLQPLAQRNRSAKEIIEGLREQVKSVEKKFKEAFIYFEEAQAVESNEIIIEIYGYDYETLNEIAVNMLSKMQSVKGLTDLKIRWRRGRPEWQVVVDKQRAAAFGLTTEEVAEAVHAAMRGLRATLFHTESKEIEVVARLQEQDRDTLAKLRRLAIPLPSGGFIYLEQVAKFVPGTGPSKIWRKNKNRMIQVSANRGRLAFGTAVGKIKESLKDLKTPKDYYYRFGENYAKMVQNQQELTYAITLTLILVYLVLASLFESFSQPFIIMVTVPLTAIGIVIALKLTHKSINIGVLIGAIMLDGIVVNNAILLVDWVNQLRERGYRLKRAIVASGTSRLRPIIMTTLTTLLGLIPMATDRSEESNLWAPLAITVIGGLSTSTILTLVVVPCIYLIFDDIRTFPSRLKSKIRSMFSKNKPLKA